MRSLHHVCLIVGLSTMPLLDGVLGQEKSPAPAPAPALQSGPAPKGVPTAQPAPPPAIKPPEAKAKAKPTSSSPPPKAPTTKPAPPPSAPSAKPQPAGTPPLADQNSKAPAPKPAPPPAPKTPPIATNLPPEQLVHQFVGRYCLECHDSSVQKGDRDFESFVLPLKTEMELIEAKDIIDQLTLKEMPPKKAEQPSDDERIAMLRALREGALAARNQIQSTGSRTIMRRLTHREYENTLATLFGRSVTTLGLTADFPKEKTSRHIDTIGQSLVTSGFLVDQYFQAANRLVETRLGKPKMKPQHWRFNGHFVQYEELSGSHKEAFNYGFLNLYEQPNTDTRQGGYGHIEDFLKGVPVSGLYDLEVEARAMHRDTHYDPEIFGIDFSEPFILGVVPGDATKGHIHYPQAIEPLLASKTLPDDKTTRVKFRVWLEVGQTPRFIFPNGPYESRASVIKVNQRYKDEFSEGEIPSSLVGRAHILLKGKLPHIRISEVQINGPVEEKGGNAEEVAVFGKGGFKEERAMDQLYAFAERAYRRPITDADRQPIRTLYEKRLSEKAAPRQAALDALKLILCSPSFLYLSEITPESEKKLQPFDLASRLSYALWSAPPDSPLFAAAKSGQLSQAAELQQQIKRMLADPRISHFVNDFLDSWLNLRDLGSQPPAREANRAYYAEDYPASMKAEARLFFHDLLKNNGSVAQFIDSEHTFVDKKLAKLYDLPEKSSLRLADGFQKVSLKGNAKRGGLLGMAGVLTVSANGVETSPVTRGIWVMENILGIQAPPPPDEVPAIDPDVTGATTVRERLAKHSTDRTCAECHRKIDPLGFSLESFDPIGRWRTHYAKPKTKDAPAPKIDTTGEFSSGESYADFDSFKAIIRQTREDHFTRHLIRQVLSYTTGRHMETTDEFEIEDIQARVKKNGLGLQTLITECLTSEIFRSR